MWSYASGRADSERRIRATPSTRYRLASVSKIVTAVAIMALVERGAIGLDAPANRYLGETKITARVGSADDVTVRRLMSHRGGLPLHYNLLHAGEDLERRSLDETIARYGQVMFLPGTVHRYSNIGYGVLERIIELQSGKSFAWFLDETFFTPLGMKSAAVLEAAVYPPNTAMPYTRAGDLYPAYDIDTRGAGGLYMTAGDLARFGRFFSDALDGKSEILSAQAAHEMLAMQSDDDSDDVEYYTLGWVHELRGKNREHDTIYHLGSTPGVRAELWIYPDRDLVVATMVNEMSYRPLYFAREAILAEYAPDITFEAKPEVAIPEAVVGRWSGVIDFGPEGEASVEFDFRESQSPKVSIGGRAAAISKAGTMDDGLFQIETSRVPLTTSDASQQHHSVWFVLALSDRRLTGFAAANRITSRLRDSGAFSYWTELKRVQDGR
ncbi:MAG: serine hydrolase domain-containing protein, partial [Myxococcota bacterium]